jgi:hypothetical protein
MKNLTGESFTIERLTEHNVWMSEGIVGKRGVEGQTRIARNEQSCLQWETEAAHRLLVPPEARMHEKEITRHDS